MDFISFNTVPDVLKDFLKTAGEVAAEDSNEQRDLVPIAWQRKDGSIAFFDDFGLNPHSISQRQAWNSKPRLPFLKVGIDVVVTTEFGVLVIHDDEKNYRRFPGGGLNFNETYRLISAVERKIFSESLYIIRKNQTNRLIPKNINSDGLKPSVDYMKISIGRFEKTGYIKYLGYSIDQITNQLNFVFGWDISEYEIPIAIFHKKNLEYGLIASYSFSCVNSKLEVTGNTYGEDGIVLREIPIPDENFHKTVIDYFNNNLLNDIAVI